MGQTQKKNNKTSSSTPCAATYTKFYESMLLIRRFEERAGQLYGMGNIGGFCHLYIGQEAVVVGIQSILTENDTVITSYRDHGHMLACGMDPNKVMAELTGRIDGYSKGKGGSMHMFSKEKGFYGGHGIVAAQVSLGTGMAFAHQYKKMPHISVTYMGDGAVNQGQVYESFNMAALWKLPVLFIIENNQYAMGTSVPRACAGEHLYQRGQAYGIPGKEVDAMNVVNVWQAAKEACAYIRQGKGPFILEMKTYRYRGHSMSDPAKYRTKEEVSEMRDMRDPITHLKNLLLEEKILTQEQIAQTDKKIKNIVLQAAEFATQSALPPEEELYTDILLNT